MASLLNPIQTFGWYEWLCHTNFSFLAGASHPSAYLKRAIKLGYAGLGVTDYDGVYGLARTYRGLRELKQGVFPGDQVEADVRETKLRFFCGAEMHLTCDHERPLIYQDTLALIAQNREGYSNLCQLVSYAHRGGKKNANVPLADWSQFSLAGLVCIQPMRGLIRRLPEADVAVRYAHLKELFAGRFYLAVSRHFNPSEDLWIEPTISLSRQLEIPCLLSQDPFFHRPSQKDVSDLMQAIRTNLTLDAAVEHMFVNGERSLHSLAGLARRFSGMSIYEEALRNSRELAERCTFDMSELRYHYPKEMIPEGYTAQAFLEATVWAAAREFCKGDLTPKLTQLLSHELQLIERLKFADYFLTVWDIVHWARSQDILCQGRGSAANSAVCFVLGITSVDPLLNDLLFERFVNVERGDPPDIDVDFEHERREEVIQYIYGRYGRDKAAMVANVITFRRRGAIRSVGKALGIPEALLEQAASMLSMRYYRGNAASETIEKLREDTSGDEANKPNLPQEPADASGEGFEDLLPGEIPWQLWGDMAERLKGFPRHLGIHSGGFMLSDQPLHSIVAQEPATMEGRTVMQWCKDDIEALGFFKIDVLSLGMLTAVRKSFAMIETHYGRKLTLASVPPDDGPTYAMIQRADTVGTFQIESRAQMSMLPRLRPRCFYDLVIEVAIIRPGPIQGGMIHPYLRRRSGQEPVVFPDERLRSILARTLGVPIFQEQVMRIAMAVGGFTPGEANELRRHMGAWNLKGDIGPWLTRLAEGMAKNGIQEDFIQVILAQMRGFADYGFPESHAASFAILAYVSSYLKCHYPAAFFAALINSQPMGFYAPHALLQTAMRDGVQVLPVCVLRSDYDVTLENVASKDKPPVFALRLGLRMVNGLREHAARKLVETRLKVEGWVDLEDFLRKSALYRGELTALAAANALSAFGVERRAALWLAEAAPFLTGLEDREDPYGFAPESNLERLQLDFASTSTSLGDHPSVIIRREHWCFAVPASKLTSARDLSGLAPGLNVTAFGMVLVRQSPPSAKGMVFFTLEDDTGFINLAFSPQVYERFFKITDRQAFLCIEGKLQKQNEGHSIMVRQVYEPKYERADVVPLTSQGSRSSETKVRGFEELQKARSYF